MWGHESGQGRDAGVDKVGHASFHRNYVVGAGGKLGAWLWISKRIGNRCREVAAQARTKWDNVTFMKYTQGRGRVGEIKRLGETRTRVWNNKCGQGRDDIWHGCGQVRSTCVAVVAQASTWEGQVRAQGTLQGDMMRCKGHVHKGTCTCTRDKHARTQGTWTRGHHSGALVCVHGDAFSSTPTILLAPLVTWLRRICQHTGTHRGTFFSTKIHTAPARITASAAGGSAATEFAQACGCEAPELASKGTYTALLCEVQARQGGGAAGREVSGWGGVRLRSWMHGSKCVRFFSHNNAMAVLLAGRCVGGAVLDCNLECAVPNARVSVLIMHWRCCWQGSGRRGSMRVSRTCFRSVCAGGTREARSLRRCVGSWHHNEPLLNCIMAERVCVTYTHALHQGKPLKNERHISTETQIEVDPTPLG
eukprot:scaffold195400_cov21-Tisochrysis_lutea.AAC.1